MRKEWKKALLQISNEKNATEYPSYNGTAFQDNVTVLNASNFNQSVLGS